MDESKRNQNNTVAGKIPKIAWIGMALGIIVILFLVIASYRKKIIDLNDYVQIEVRGYEGYGNAVAFIDWDMITAKYGDYVSYSDRELQESISGYIPPIEALQEYIDIDFDRSSGLSNGDTISYRWIIDEDALKYFDCKIKYKEASYTVSGLEEVENFDAFTDLEVTFSGTDPNGFVEWKYNGDILSDADFHPDVSESLKNGDKVIFSINQDTINDCVTTYGKIPSILEKEYEVTGLESYLKQTSEIKEDELAKLKKQASDVFNSVAVHWDESLTVESLDYVGNYLLTSKDYKSSLDMYNELILVYKVKVRAKFSKGEKTFDEINEYYWYISFQDIIVNREGNLVLDIDNYKKAESTLEIDSGITTTARIAIISQTKTWTVQGYKSLDELYKKLVISKGDKYNHEDNILEN